MSLWVQLDMPELGAPDHIFGAFPISVYNPLGIDICMEFVVLFLIFYSGCLGTSCYFVLNTHVLGYQAYRVRNLDSLKHLVQIMYNCEIKPYIADLL